MASRVAEIAAVLNRLDEVRWDRCTAAGDVVVYGWIDRVDGRADFLVLEFWATEGGELGYRVVATSSAELSESIVSRICGQDAQHIPCQRVENVFRGLVPNAVKLEKTAPAVGERPRRPRLRTEITAAELPQEILHYLRHHPDSSGRDIANGLGVPDSAVCVALKQVVNKVTLRNDPPRKLWRLKEAEARG